MIAKVCGWSEMEKVVVGSGLEAQHMNLMIDAGDDGLIPGGEDGGGVDVVPKELIDQFEDD